MANDLAVIESMLTPLADRFDAALAPSGMSSKRLIQSILVSIERLPALADPEKVERATVIQAAMSAACLGLEVDGYTGQAFIIPFKRHAQLVIGYKGFNTLAARSGFVINGASVYENDEFSFDLGDGLITHRHGLKERGRLIAVWAQGRHKTLGSLTLTVLGIDEIMEVKAKSPGAKRSDSPWNDAKIGFAAMAEKTAKRRQARSMPLNVMQLGAAMDGAYEERGLHSRIDPDKGVIIEGDAIDQPASPLPERQKAKEAPPIDITTDTYTVTLGDGSDRTFTNEMDWLAFMKRGFSKIGTLEHLEKFMNRNTDHILALRSDHPEIGIDCENAYNERYKQLYKPKVVDPPQSTGGPHQEKPGE